jgi:hypothetical protein
MLNARRTVRIKLQGYQGVEKDIIARLGLKDGTVVVDSSDPLIVWVVPFKGIPEQVLNIRVPNVPGKMVRVGYDPGSSYPKRKQVLGHWDIFPKAQLEGLLNHWWTHAWGAYDCSWVERERILYCAPVPGENKIDIYPDAKYLSLTGTWWAKRNATRVDYSAQIPTSGARACFVVLNAAGTITFRNGADITGGPDDLDETDYPALTAGDSGIIGLRLFAGISEARHEPGNDTFIDLSQSGANGGSTSGISELTGHVVAVGPGAAVAAIQPGVVTNVMLENKTGPIILGRKDATPGAVQDLSLSDMLEMGVGIWGTEQELVNELPDGSRTHFTFTNAAYKIEVLLDGLTEKSENVTFTSMTTAFDLAVAPATGRDLRIKRLVPTVPLPPMVPAWLLDHPDNVPLVPDAWDDEFEGASLDGAWSIIGTDAPTVTVGRSLVNISCPAVNQRVKGIVKTISPESAWTLQTHGYLEGAVNNYVGLGFIVVAPTTGYLLFAGATFYGTYGYAAPFFMGLSDPTTYVKETGYNTWSLCRDYYMQLEYDGTDYIMSWSASGKNFLEVGRVARTWYPGAADPVQIGLGIHNYGPAISASFDWLRRVA